MNISEVKDLILFCKDIGVTNIKYDNLECVIPPKFEQQETMPDQDRAMLEKFLAGGPDAY
jgi:hypothetical protein